MAKYWNYLYQENMKRNNVKYLFHPKSIETDEKIIWQYWGQGINSNLPPLVKLSFASIDKYKGDFRVIRLDNNSIYKYLDIPEWILEKLQTGQLSYTFFSDILRLALLYHYGGIWIDSTIVLTAKIDKKYLQNEYFLFQRIKKAENKNIFFSYNRFYFNWNLNHKVNIMNGFFYSKKGSEDIFLLLNLLVNYWNINNKKKEYHYFLFQILFEELKSNNKLKFSSMLVIDDTLPHLLLLKLKNRIDMNDYNNITGRINIHVLRHNIAVEHGSYYEHIINTIDRNLLSEFTSDK